MTDAPEPTPDAYGRPVYVIHWHPRRLRPHHLDDLVDGFKQMARILRRRGFQDVSANVLWKVAGLRNPLRVQSGRLGGSQAYKSVQGDHERAVRKKARAAMGGMAVFTRGGRNPSTYGKLLRQNRTRRARGLPPLDLSG